MGAWRSINDRLMQPGNSYLCILRDDHSTFLAKFVSLLELRLDITGA